MRTPELWAFARERHLAHLRRSAGGPPPWTDDPIIRTYRFCNVYRELDAVTRWLAAEWRGPRADDPDLWFAMVVARHLNVPECMAELGYPSPWDPARFREVCRSRLARRARVFSGAYLIGTSAHAGSKADYLEERVLTPMWGQRMSLRPRPGDSLTSYHVILGQLYGLGSFLAAQVVADLKYVRPLSWAADWHEFAASGPGSRRGMNRLLDRPLLAPWREDDWRLALRRAREALLPEFAAYGWERPHGQDVQNLLCEWDKYERARLGEGRPKQLFRSGGRG